MSKITFRADDDLVERLEDLNASKSEVMREALREFLDRQERPEDAREESTSPTVDDALAARIDDLVQERLDAHLDGRSDRPARDVNVNITVDGATATEEPPAEESQPSIQDRQPDGRRTGAESGETCEQCGERLDGDHVYCPNCGEKRSRRAFCECGDEVRTDWAFCPSCGRRTPAADVLDRS